MENPVDLTNLHDLTDGDVALERDLFNEFFRSSQDCIQVMESNFADGNNEEWRRGAHAFKGISYNLGAEHLGNLCKVAQESSDLDRSDKLVILNNIKAEFTTVQDYLKSVHKEG